MHYKQNDKESKTYVQGLRAFGNTLPRGVKGILKKSLIALSVGTPDQIIQYASKYNKDVMPYFSLILIRFD